MKRIKIIITLTALLFLVQNITLGQTRDLDNNEYGKEELIEINEEVVDVPYAVIENVPVYPGCKGKDNLSLKNCMSDKISTFVNRNFNVKKVSKKLKDGVYRIFVSFKIDTQGKIVSIRSRAPHPALEKEAIRVIKKLPQIEPGRQRGEVVGVLYSLPITFKVDNTPSKKRT